MKRLSGITSMGVLAMILAVGVAIAQESCAVFLEEALSAVEMNCDELGRNEACYGYNRVEASFLSDVDDTFFAQPADVTAVESIETIRTAPLSTDDEEWGVAVMLLQANLPETLPGQNVTFVLMGDTELENAVAPEDAFQGGETVDVTVTFAQGAAIRSGAGDTFNTIGGVPVGTIFTADGISADGAWLRVIDSDNQRPGWIRRSVVAEDAAIDSLPTLDNDLYTPMQAFYLRTGIGQTSCSDIPSDSVMVQGPDDITVEITVNGANIELGSTGMLRIVEDTAGEPALEITVIDGQFTVKADEHNPQDVVIPAGHRSRLCMGEVSDSGLDGEANDLTVSCAASVPEVIPPDAFNTDWCAMEQMPASLLNYPLSACYDGTHTVASGENLFRIAQFYCVTLDDLIGINGITDVTSLQVGQTLTVPLGACDGVGSTRPPENAVVDTPEVTAEPDDALVDSTDGTINGVACSTFTVPLQTVVDNQFTLDWDDVAGATTYTVAVFDDNDFETATFSTTTSSITLNGGGFPSVGYIDVRAYNDGVYACYARMPFTRVGVNDVPDNGEFGFQVVSCGYTGPDYALVVEWVDAPTTPLTITWADAAGISGSATKTTTSGSATFVSTSSFVTVSIQSGNDTQRIAISNCL